MMKPHVQRAARPTAILALLMLIAVIGAGWANAQSGLEQIALGENKTGTLAADSPTAEYVLLLEQPTRINVSLFAITPGLAPSLRVLDGSGVELGVSVNPGTQNAVQVDGVNAPVGILRLQVSSASAQAGDFLLTVEAEAAIPPVPLPLGQIVNGQLSAAASRLVYGFTGEAAQGRWLFVQSLLTTSGPIITVTDAGTLETFVTIGARVRVTRLLLPAGAAEYLVEVAYGSAADSEAFTICLAPENDPAACPVPGVQPATPTAAPTTAPVVVLPPLPPSDVCILASSTGGSVNVRSGPNTSFSLVGQLNGSTIVNVIGRLADNSWYQIDGAGLTGWISATVARVGGPCNLVPIITPTATPTGTLLTPTGTGTGATATATATGTPPTATNTGIAPTATATNTGIAPTATNTGIAPTATPTEVPPTATLIS
ncbi:MAG: SH3 domain-containing protein [bacterium]|nr:SH3 domain-containing protein [bacterium]